MGSLAGVWSELLSRIACPRCKAQLEAGGAPVSLRCTGCGRNYPIVDGIPILLIERAMKSSG
jgi:uncharacterized protein YbaR (Trm112 family)